MIIENWEQILAVQKMQDYIEAHLNAPITLHLLAQEAGYSPWHSAKLFKEITGSSPFEYIRQYRLSKAALALRDNDLKILDVAMDFVFDSHEGFTRAFCKQFKITPSAYKQHTPPLSLFHPWSVFDSHYYFNGREKEYPPLSDKFNIQIRHFPKRKLILKRGICSSDYFSYCEEVGCELWGILCSIKEALYEPVGMWLPDSLRPENTSCYVQGVEVPCDYQGKIPESFTIMELPECQMMLFQGEPYESFRFEEAVTGLSEIINQYDPRIHGYQWADEGAPRIQLEPQGWRGYLEGRPVEEIKTVI